MFLAVLIKTVIDVQADPEADPPVSEESHIEVEQTFLENAATQVAANLAAGLSIEYYDIQFNGAQLQATLHPVSLKATPRVSGPTTEVAEIEAAGQDVGSAVVPV